MPHKNQQVFFIGDILQHLKTLCKTIYEGFPNLWCQREFKVHCWAMEERMMTSERWNYLWISVGTSDSERIWVKNAVEEKELV